MERFPFIFFSLCISIVYTYTIVNIFILKYAGKLLSGYENLSIIIVTVIIYGVSRYLLSKEFAKKYNLPIEVILLSLLMWPLISILTIMDDMHNESLKDIAFYFKRSGIFCLGTILSVYIINKLKPYILNKFSKKNSADSSTKQSEGRK